MVDMTEKERQDTKMATLYELRLLFTQGEKKEYTTDEIVELLDKIATAKDSVWIIFGKVAMNSGDWEQLVGWNKLLLIYTCARSKAGSELSKMTEK